MKPTKFVSHQSELYSILYEFYKMTQACALKQTTSFCAAKVNPDSSGMDPETSGLSPKTPTGEQ